MNTLNPFVMYCTHGFNRIAVMNTLNTPENQSTGYEWKISKLWLHRVISYQNIVISKNFLKNKKNNQLSSNNCFERDSNYRVLAQSGTFDFHLKIDVPGSVL